MMVISKFIVKFYIHNIYIFNMHHWKLEYHCGLNFFNNYTQKNCLLGHYWEKSILLLQKEHNPYFLVMLAPGCLSTCFAPHACCCWARACCRYACWLFALARVLRAPRLLLLLGPACCCCACPCAQPGHIETENRTPSRTEPKPN